MRNCSSSLSQQLARACFVRYSSGPQSFGFRFVMTGTCRRSCAADSPSSSPRPATACARKRLCCHGTCPVRSLLEVALAWRQLKAAIVGGRLRRHSQAAAEVGNLRRPPSVIPCSKYLISQACRRRPPSVAPRSKYLNSLVSSWCNEAQQDVALPARAANICF